MNVGDISPNYAGVIMGISNTFANIPGFLAPLVTGVVVGDKHELADWTVVFLIGAAIVTFCNILYLIWASADQQPFDIFESKTVDKEEVASEGEVAGAKGITIIGQVQAEKS